MHMQQNSNTHPTTQQCSRYRQATNDTAQQCHNNTDATATTDFVLNDTDVTAQPSRWRSSTTHFNNTCHSTTTHNTHCTPLHNATRQCTSQSPIMHLSNLNNAHAKAWQSTHQSSMTHISNFSNKYQSSTKQMSRLNEQEAKRNHASQQQIPAQRTCRGTITHTLQRNSAHVREQLHVAA